MTLILLSYFSQGPIPGPLLVHSESSISIQFKFWRPWPGVDVRYDFHCVIGVQNVPAPVRMNHCPPWLKHQTLWFHHVLWSQREDSQDDIQYKASYILFPMHSIQNTQNTKPRIPLLFLSLTLIICSTYKLVPGSNSQKSFLTGGTLVLSFNFQAEIRIVLPSVSDTPHGIVHRGLMKNLTSEYKLHF